MKVKGVELQWRRLNVVQLVEVRHSFRRQRGQIHGPSDVVQMFIRLSELCCLGQAAWQRIHGFRLGRQAANNHVHGNAIRTGCSALAEGKGGPFASKESQWPRKRPAM